MRSQRSREGELLIDHRASPGVSDELMRSIGMPAGSGKGLFEAPTYTCSHCSSVVVINPDRKRERAYCAKCDSRICDDCGAILAQTRECKTFKQLMDEVQEKAAKQQVGSIIIPT